MNNIFSTCIYFFRLVSVMFSTANGTPLFIEFVAHNNFVNIFSIIVLEIVPNLIMVLPLRFFVSLSIKLNHCQSNFYTCILMGPLHLVFNLKNLYMNLKSTKYSSFSNAFRIHAKWSVHASLICISNVQRISWNKITKWTNFYLQCH